MPQDVTLWGASYSGCPSVLLPKTGGGAAPFFCDMQMGIIRPDAEMIQEWKYDKLIVEDEEKTIPAYTTSATTLLASSNLSPTIVTDRDNYDYFVVIRGLAYPIYTSGTVKAKGYAEYSLNGFFYEMLYVPIGAMLTLDGNTSNPARHANVTAMGNMGRLMYWTNGSTVALNASSTYATYVNAQAPGISTTSSNCTLTIKTPQLNMRGHDSYMNATAWAAVEDVRYQWIEQVWRVKKGNGTNGWTSNSNMEHDIECVNSSTHKLT